eukprot:305323-Pyramimonas_sp.AAC.1
MWKPRGINGIYVAWCQWRHISTDRGNAIQCARFVAAEAPNASAATRGGHDASSDSHPLWPTSTRGPQLQAPSRAPAPREA